MRQGSEWRCRSCGSSQGRLFADLGLSPISNAFAPPSAVLHGQLVYPLQVFACSRCRLAQVGDVDSRESHFHKDYPYFSSYSESWLRHTERYCSLMVEKLALGSNSKVVEIASNDGYLLKNFIQAGIPCLGVDPAANCADAAKRNFGVDTRVGFFGKELAQELAVEGWRADLIIANNVLAHVPDLNDFVAGFQALLGPDGVITFEFPHLLTMIRGDQFDTIYHEHYSYISLFAAEALLTRHGLRVFDVEQLGTHGGSLRLFVCHASAGHPETPAVSEARRAEIEAGVDTDAFYVQFGERMRRAKWRLLSLLLRLKSEGARIAAYGAAAKGTTLLNYCGIGADLIEFVADRNPHKQGRYMPGTTIPIVVPDTIDRVRPDYVLILPWNIREEIIGSLEAIRTWGGRFIVPVPEPVILD